MILAGCSKETEKITQKPTETTSTIPSTPTVKVEVPVQLPPIASPVKPRTQQPEKQPTSNIIAIVNGKEITRNQVMFVLKNSQKQRRGNMNFGSAVQMLIGNILITDLVEKEKITITKEDFLAMRQTLAKTIPNGITIEQFMKEKGISEKSLQRVIENRIKLERTLKNNGEDTSVTDSEIDLFIRKNENNPNAIKNGQKKGMELIKDIRKQLLAGADFAELAKKYSTCPSGKRAGGNLGKFGRGQMAPPFEKAAFTQKINDIGPVIKTTFGLHIIQVTEKKAAGEISAKGIPVPEYVKARHILIPPAITREEAMFSLQQRKTRDALASLVEKLQKTADIKHIDMPDNRINTSSGRPATRPTKAPIKPNNQPRIQPSTRNSVRSKPAPKKPPRNVVVSRPVQSPVFQLEEVEE